MTYNPNIDSGFATTKNWVQVPSAVFASIDQSTELDNSDEPERSARNYARLVYQVNATPISGDISISSVGLNADGTVQLSGDQLKVFDGTLVTEIQQVNAKLNNIVVSEIYSRIVQTFGTDTYIAHAPIGSLSSDAVWRVQKIDVDGSRQWADSASFTQSCSADLSGLVYTY